MRYTFRPLPAWPYEKTNPRRYAQFKTPSRWVDGQYVPGGQRIPWEQTLRDLASEIEALDGDDAVIGVGLGEWDIRQDGMPRANARANVHPGVEISFNSRYGRLTYATDVFYDWRDNVRAIAKGLEALRAVERWGVAKRGQQYAGFALLTAGPGLEERGKRLVEQYGSVTKALRAVHPDTGGETADVGDFQAVKAYRDSLGALA